MSGQVAVVANTQLFAADGSLVATVYTPPARLDVVVWRDRLFIAKLGRFVEATVYESSE